MTRPGHGERIELDRRHHTNGRPGHPLRRFVRGRSFCVGGGEGAGAGPPLMEQWDGTAWTVMPGPPSVRVGARGRQLRQHDLLRRRRRRRYDTLVEQWDGTAWTVVTSPDQPGATSTYLQGISCTGATFCMAVGQAFFGSSTTPRSP